MRISIDFTSCSTFVWNAIGLWRDISVELIKNLNQEFDSKTHYSIIDSSLKVGFSQIFYSRLQAMKSLNIVKKTGKGKRAKNGKKNRQKNDCVLSRCSHALLSHSLFVSLLLYYSVLWCVLYCNLTLDLFQCGWICVFLLRKICRDPALSRICFFMIKTCKRRVKWFRLIDVDRSANIRSTNCSGDT